MPLISTKNLVKSYGQGELEVRALDGVSLDIEAGDFVAIIGASGSVKSTFMNIFQKPFFCVTLTPKSSKFWLLLGCDASIRSLTSMDDCREREISQSESQYRAQETVAKKS